MSVSTSFPLVLKSKRGANLPFSWLSRSSTFSKSRQSTDSAQSRVNKVNWKSERNEKGTRNLVLTYSKQNGHQHFLSFHRSRKELEGRIGCWIRRKNTTQPPARVPRRFCEIISSNQAVSSFFFVSEKRCNFHWNNPNKSERGATDTVQVQVQRVRNPFW